jgi:hemerythrin-like domain-containing protein
MNDTRRTFLQKTAVLSASAFAVMPLPAQQSKAKPEAGGEDVSPTEDLMREHGLLNRVLLVYEDCLRKLDASVSQEAPKFDPKLLADSAGIIRHFIEDYHEKLEEDYIFPRFEKAHVLTDLVKVLRRQHEAGRSETEKIQKLATAAALKQPASRSEVAGAISHFVRMYRPHEAREDTVLFPALHGLVSQHEYDALGEDFEKREHQLFGAEGFEGEVEKVAGIEKALGIYDLAKFT